MFYKCCLLSLWGSSYSNKLKVRVVFYSALDDAWVFFKSHQSSALTPESCLEFLLKHRYVDLNWQRIYSKDSN